MRIHCVRCNRKISDQVATCPHCGSYNESVPEIKKTETTEKNKPEKRGFWKKLSGVRPPGLLWLFVSIVLIAGYGVRIYSYYSIYRYDEFIYYDSFGEYMSNQQGGLGLLFWGIFSFIGSISFVSQDFSTSEEEREAKLKEEKETKLKQQREANEEKQEINRIWAEKMQRVKKLKCHPHLKNIAYVCGYESVNGSTDAVLGFLAVEDDQLRYLSNMDELFCIPIAKIKLILYDTLERINLIRVTSLGLTPILSIENNYYLVIDYLAEDGALHTVIFHPSVKDDVFFHQLNLAHQQYASIEIKENKPKEDSSKGINEKLMVLKGLFEQELISEKEYTEKKMELLKTL